MKGARSAQCVREQLGADDCREEKLESMTVLGIWNVPQPRANACVVRVFPILLGGGPLDAHPRGADNGAGNTVLLSGHGVHVSGALGTMPGADSLPWKVGSIVVDVGAAAPVLVQFPQDDVGVFKLSQLEEWNFWRGSPKAVDRTVQAIAGDRMNSRIGAVIGLGIEGASENLGRTDVPEECSALEVKLILPCTPATTEASIVKPSGTVSD